jgi:hypothetical protein
MEQTMSLEQLSLAAAEEGRDLMADLGIKGSTASGKVVVVARVTINLPNVKTYFMNSRRLLNVELKLMDKYPGVSFDFDYQFTNGHQQPLPRKR